MPKSSAECLSSSDSDTTAYPDGFSASRCTIVAATSDALRSGRNTHFTVLEFPGLNHTFRVAETGMEMDYVKIE